jgi:hypothetical protein
MTSIFYLTVPVSTRSKYVKKTPKSKSRLDIQQLVQEIGDNGIPDWLRNAKRGY